MINKIVSGGQTGVDRAALDIAIFLGIDYGGWCPKGRLDENGTIPDIYTRLVEVEGDFLCEAENYELRTKKNIIDSDGTLIIVPTWPLPDSIKDGTTLTIKHAKDSEKPHLIISLSNPCGDNVFSVSEWLYENNIECLNIAGPRESNHEGIYLATFEFMQNYYSTFLPRISRN